MSAIVGRIVLGPADADPAIQEAIFTTCGLITLGSGMYIWHRREIHTRRRERVSCSASTDAEGVFRPHGQSTLSGLGSVGRAPARYRRRERTGRSLELAGLVDTMTQRRTKRDSLRFTGSGMRGLTGRALARTCGALRAGRDQAPATGMDSGTL